MRRHKVNVKKELADLVKAAERYETIEKEYQEKAGERDQATVNKKEMQEEVDRLAGLSMRQDRVLREAARVYVRKLTGVDDGAREENP